MKKLPDDIECDLRKTDLQILEPPLWRCKMDLELKTSPAFYPVPMLEFSCTNTRKNLLVSKICRFLLSNLSCSDRSGRRVAKSIHTEMRDQRITEPQELRKERTVTFCHSSAKRNSGCWSEGSFRCRDRRREREMSIWEKREVEDEEALGGPSAGTYGLGLASGPGQGKMDCDRPSPRKFVSIF